jgi:hypothetical protein
MGKNKNGKIKFKTIKISNKGRTFKNKINKQSPKDKKNITIDLDFKINISLLNIFIFMLYIYLLPIIAGILYPGYKMTYLVSACYLVSAGIVLKIINQFNQK